MSAWFSSGYGRATTEELCGGEHHVRRHISVSVYGLQQHAKPRDESSAGEMLAPVFVLPLPPSIFRTITLRVNRSLVELISLFFFSNLTVINLVLSVVSGCRPIQRIHVYTARRWHVHFSGLRLSQRETAFFLEPLLFLIVYLRLVGRFVAGSWPRFNLLGSNLRLPSLSWTIHSGDQQRIRSLQGHVVRVLRLLDLHCMQCLLILVRTVQASTNAFL